jgi:RNA polymerase sigma factor (sigma-70 family)
MPGFEYDRGRGRFRGYLKTVVRHAIVDRIGQNRGRRGVSVIDNELPDPHAEADLDAVWEQQWRSYHVMQAMRTIDVEFGEIERLAFTRYAREGRSADEVARTLGISVDRVYQAKSRILRRVSALVAEQILQEG